MKLYIEIDLRVVESNIHGDNREEFARAALAVAQVMIEQGSISLRSCDKCALGAVGTIQTSDDEHHPDKRETEAALLKVVRDIVANSRSGLHETLAVRLQGALHKYDGARA